MSRPTRLTITPLEARDVPAVALDAGFGSGGIVYDNRLSGSSSVLFLQNDGKAVAGSPGGVARYNTDGTFDTSFHADGFAALAGDEAPVGVQAGGKIVVANANGRISRLNADGSLDTTFGTDGFTQAFGTEGVAFQQAAVAKNGGIVVVGQYGGAARTVALTADGQMYATFAPIASSVAGTPISLAVADDGSFYVGGKRDLIAGDTYTTYGFIAHFSPIGDLDTAFGTEGVVAVQETQGIWGLAIAPGGRVVAQTGGPTWIRFNADGSRDETFATATAPGIDMVQHGLAVQADGSVVAAGYSSTGDYAVVRFTPTGANDPTFNNGQVQYVDLGAADFASDLVIEADGQILVSGSTTATGATGLGLARVDPSATAAVPLTLAVSDASVGYGETVSLTASAMTATGGPATGSVAFKNGNVTLGTVSLVNGMATFAWKANRIGNLTLSATHLGTSTPAVMADVTVAKGTITPKPLVMSPTTPAQGQWTRLTFDYTSAAAAIDVIGTVTFKDNGVVIGTASVRPGKITELAFAAPAQGSHTYTAEYSGNAVIQGAMSAPLTVNVARPLAVVTTTTVETAARPAVGKAIELKAMVKTRYGARVDGGTVTFREAGINGRLLGTANVVRGEARFSFTPTSLPARGTVVVMATYNGTAAAAASTSATVAVTPRIDTRLTIAPSRAVAGRSFTLTATLSATQRTTALTGGVITFRDGSRVLGTAALNANGVATLTIARLGSAPLAVSATYGGTLDYYAATSTTQSVAVLRDAKVTLAVTGSPLAARKAITLRATVTGEGRPGGVVTFRAGSAVMGRATVDASGKATFTYTPGLVKGRHSFSATYEGNAQYASTMTSAAVTLA